MKARPGSLSCIWIPLLIVLAGLLTAVLAPIRGWDRMLILSTDAFAAVTVGVLLFLARPSRQS